jgi:CubicO group peptidase (beta-lactamase class C family)
MRLFIFLLFVSSLSFGQKPAPALEQKIKEFEQDVENARKQWDVPGLAVAVVKDGQVIFKKGFGVRELGKPDPVNTETLFVCASTTKAMTAACMGILVDEGKVKWDDPVINYLPDLQLYDANATREIRIRDLFTHNTGVGNADFLWTYMDIPSDDILKKMRDVKPSYSLRSGFIYQNIFYLAAGKVIEKASGKTWDKFIRERLFQPLKMTATVPLIKEVTTPNKAAPHARIEDKITVIEHTNADQIAPAASVWSNADDMSKWIACMLDSSKYEGGRLLKAATWTEMFKPQVIAPVTFYSTNQLLKPNWTTYGFGWYQHDYKGRKVNLHTGSLAGAIAIHAQLPDEKLGIYVFGNFGAEVRHALVYKCFDLFALGGNRDWSTEFKKLYDNLNARSEKSLKDFEANRVMNTKPTLAIESYAGKYNSPIYGNVEITVNGNALVVNANNFSKATLEHWNYDTFRGWFSKRWWGKVNAVFNMGANGKLSGVIFNGIDYRKVEEPANKPVGN